MKHTEQLTAEVEALKKAIVEFVHACPDFPEGEVLAGNLGRAMANVETTLHWHFDCWKLGLPGRLGPKGNPQP